jgi:8-oxo-dGTP pyrophosphatase MutT (NUDIX family)
MYKRLSNKIVYQNPWTKVREYQIEMPDGSPSTYAVLERNNGAVILVRNKRNEVLLMRQYRFPVDAEDWELPGGGVNENEDPDLAVKRELFEETGVKVDEVVFIAEYFALSSAASEKVRLYFAQVDEFGTLETHDQEEEVIGFKVVSLQEAVAMVMRGEIQEVFSSNAILSLKEYLQSPSI